MHRRVRAALCRRCRCAADPLLGRLRQDVWREQAAGPGLHPSGDGHLLGPPQAELACEDGVAGRKPHLTESGGWGREIALQVGRGEVTAEGAAGGHRTG